MANCINSTSLKFLRSVNTPDYPTADGWVINPDMSQVTGVNPKYWKWDGTRPIPMTSGEQIALDASAVEDARDAVAAQLDRQEDVLRAVVAAIVGELNAHSDKVNLMLSEIALATSLADFKTRMGTIPDLPQRSMAQLKTVVRNALGS